jgi:hypothetical protein
LAYSAPLWGCVAGNQKLAALQIGGSSIFSALFTLYEAALLSDKYEVGERHAIFQSLESTSSRIAVFSAHLFADISLVDIDKMSPFVPYSLYQSAVVQYRLFQQTAQMEYQRNFESLKSILGSFKRRWLVAGQY